MNINEDYQKVAVPESQLVMDIAMSWIHENLIQPLEEKLTEEQAMMLVNIGAGLRIVADKANAYEEIEAEGYKESPYLKN
jgi:hypothetical protein|tara:strand:+ start:177 stop:416 length:240 start_codon:yes stop_codon:yes gene_type:complete